MCAKRKEKKKQEVKARRQNVYRERVDCSFCFTVFVIGSARLSRCLRLANSATPVFLSLSRCTLPHTPTPSHDASTYIEYVYTRKFTPKAYYSSVMRSSFATRTAYTRECAAAAVVSFFLAGTRGTRSWRIYVYTHTKSARKIR